MYWTKTALHSELFVVSKEFPGINELVVLNPFMAKKCFIFYVD